MAKKKNSLLIILPILTFFAVIIAVGVHSLIEPEDEKQKIKVYVADSEITSGYSNFKEYSEEITTPDLDGMPNYIDADNTVIGNSNPIEKHFCGNKNSKVYHKLECSALKKMKEENKVYFSSKDECNNNGYKPCSRCKP